MSLAGIGLATGASMPWVLKFLWAPVVDRLGSRRTWIRACLVLLAAVTVLLAGRRPRAPRRRARRAASHVCDALGDAGHRDRRVHHRDHARAASWASPTRSGSRRTAGRASSPARCWSGWPRGAGGTGRSSRARRITGALAAASFLLPETERGAQHAESLTEPIAAMLRRPGIWAVILFALTFKLDISAMDPMTKPFWLDRGLTLDQIAALTTGRLIATLAGAALGGRARDADRAVPGALDDGAGAAAVEPGVLAGGRGAARPGGSSRPRRCSRTSPRDWGRRRSSRS